MRHLHETDENIEPLCARLRTVLEETRDLDRRDFLRALGKAGLAGVLSTAVAGLGSRARSEEHTSELQSRRDLVCRLLLEKKKKKTTTSKRIKKKLTHNT